MKTILTRVAVLLLALLLLLSMVGCKPSGEDGNTPDDDVNTPNGEDQGGDDTQASDPATDGVFDILDYDPEKTYELADMRSLDMTEYLTLGRFEQLTLTLSVTDVTVTDEMVEERIQTILSENHPDAKITDRAVTWGDTVVVDYVGKKDGVAFDRGSAQNQTIAIEEENGYIPGFIEGLVGVVPGVPTDASMTFPENYDTASLAGQDVVFTFTVHYIVGEPELTDDFVADYTEGTYTTADAYRESIRTEMNEQAKELAVRNAFWTKIADNTAVKKYPEESVLYYYDYYYQMYSYYASMYGVDADTYLMYFYGSSLTELFGACCDMVKSVMVYYAVCNAKGYTYTEEQYERALELYTEENWEDFNEQMSAAGEGSYTREQAKDYFNKEMKETIILQVLEEIAYNDLISGYQINITPAAEATS